MTMKLVTLPDATTRPLPFYLAEEEWLARRYAEGDFFFMWQVEPTVIIGRNQLAAKEIDIDFCRSQVKFSKSVRGLPREFILI